MPEDKLTELFSEWQRNVEAPTLFQAFQGGLTTGAVSMRERAVKVIQTTQDNIGHRNPLRWDDEVVNNLINEIGQLSDIP